MGKGIKFSTPNQPGLHKVVDRNMASLEVLELWVLNLEANKDDRFETCGTEVCCVCISGKVQVSYGDRSAILEEGDSLYLPRKWTAIFRSEAKARIVICAAEAWKDSEPLLTRFADAWRSKQGHEVHGKYNFTRDIVNLLGRTDSASRLVAGITFGQDGVWTSWPPHHHSATLEEIYYYFDIPDNGFGVHIGMFMDGTERAEIVRDGDLVIVPNGYHPTVATPGTRIKYLWFLGAKTSEEDRRAKAQDHPNYA